MYANAAVQNLFTYILLDRLPWHTIPWQALISISIMNKGKLFILSGQSGVGKNTIMQAIIKNNPNFHRAVTFTTRKPRIGEVNGMDHFFTDDNTFEKMIINNEFLEYAKVHNLYYGTPKKQIVDALENGKNVIMEIDVQGAQQVKEKMPEMISIFIQYEPGEIDQLIRKRIANDPHRKNLNEDEIQQRIISAKEEAEYIKYYDYTVTNPEGHPEKAIGEVEKIIMENIK